MRHPQLKRNNANTGYSIHSPEHPVKKDANIVA